MSDYLDINNEELLKDFFSEAEQQVEQLESNILVIENDPTNHEAIDEIFRAAHTLKGGSATVEMLELSGFTHVLEDLLDELRSGNVSVTEPVVDVLLSAIDIIKLMLEERMAGSVYTDDVEPLKDKLKSFIPAKQDKKSVKAKNAPVTLTKNVAKKEKSVAQSSAKFPEISEYEMLELKESCAVGEKLWTVIVDFDEENPMNSVGGIQVFAALKRVGTVLKTVPDFDVLYEDEFQPQVIYYVASKSNAEEIENVALIDDVVLRVDAHSVETNVAIATTQQSNAKDVEPEVVSKPKEVLYAEDTVESETDLHKINEDTKIAQEKQKKVAPPSGQATTGSVLRVDSKRIDYLLNLVSETVITKAAFNQIALHFAELQIQLQNSETAYKEKVRNLLEQMPDILGELQSGTSLKDIKAKINEEYADIYGIFDNFDTSFKNVATKFRSSTQNLGRIAGELQEGVMKIRMVPISQIFSRFPRVIRDLSKDLDKKINLVIEGEDTELDKSVIEDLLDPIMHCVRNSIDHGIEIPSVRLANGKSEEGTLSLKASNEGNIIVIDIIDDGKGIDVNTVRQKAIDRGLIHPSKVISDQDAYQLIFEPGFSTAKKVTNVSGRGVGLDVVKTQIEKLNGNVVVTSARNEGTKFSIRLPLTLAIIQGLLVRVGKEVYSIPIASVIESHRVKAEEISTIDNYEVLNVRNEVISVLRLSRLFGIKDTIDSEYSFIVIVGTTDKKIGIMVDALIGEEDVVIKPLRDQFTNSPGIAGASILGDGSVSLIIDVSQLLELGIRQELNAREERNSAF
ncbi:MAG: chemotaxis protein CheA [Treponema sp.]|nr:chemotaxis protein CheA [Treponema sp.]